MTQFNVFTGVRLISAALLILLSTIACDYTANSEHHPTKQTLRFAQERSVAIFYGVSGVSRASGLLLDDGKTIITVLHALPPEGKTIFVANDHKKRIPAEIIVSEPRIDLMILQINEFLPTDGSIRWRGREDLKPGDPLFLVGSPYGLDNSLLLGYLSHTDRSGLDVAFETIPFLQSMGLSYPGTSGGAVFDYTGSVVGINRATYGTAEGNGIGLIIPAAYVKVFLQRYNIVAE